MPKARKFLAVSAVEVSGESYSVTQVTTIYLNGKRFMKPVETKVTVRDGDVMLTMDGSTNVSADANAFALPKRLAVGLELPVGEAEISLNGLQVKQTTTFHKVVAREEITVPAGTFDCYVVERQYTAETMGISTKSTIKTWYARGIGTVKSETYDEENKLRSGMILIEYLAR